MRKCSWFFIAGMVCLAACGGGNGGDVLGNPTLPAATSTSPPAPSLRAIYVTTNASSSNVVLAFVPRAGGDPTLLGMYPTTGKGAGSHADFSSDAVRISDDHRFLFAVDSGSNSIASFRINAGYDLAFAGSVSSGGLSPNNLAVRGTSLFVTNSGDLASGVPPTVNGFLIQNDGTLLANGGSVSLDDPTRSTPSDALFDSTGTALIVPDFRTSKIDFYPIDAGKIAGAPAVVSSSGALPFGAKIFANTLVVSESAGSVSSYATAAISTAPITSALANGERGTCWLALTPNGRYAYVSNTQSGTISSYSVATSGALTLLAQTAAISALGSSSQPLDIAVAQDGSRLYQLYGAGEALEEYAIAGDGSLRLSGAVTGLPSSSQGVALLYF
jgi:6-phosphogluconolactonase